jgi:predicted nucleic acid-binding protein
VAGLDTTFLSDILRQDEAAVRTLARLAKSDQRHVTTSLNAAELYQGAASSRKGTKMRLEIAELLDGLVVLPMDREAAKLFGTLAADLASRGTPSPFMDLMIAATLLAHGETTIITRNVKDFDRIPGIMAQGY